MYDPRNVDDVPYPFDPQKADGDDGDEDEVGGAEIERGDATKKASKRSLVVVGRGKAEPAEMSKKAKSHGPKALFVLNQLELGPKGSFKHFEYLEEARKDLSMHAEYDLWCAPCGIRLGTCLNVWQGHFTTQGHLDAKKKAKPMGVGTVQAKLGGLESQELANERARLAQDVQDHRVRVVRAAMSTSLSINVVEQDGDIKELLQEPRSRRLPLGSNLAQDTKGPLQKEIAERYTRELGGKRILVTFDATPRADDVLVVLFSFVNEDFDISDHLVTLHLYGASLTGVEYYDVILEAMEKYGVKRQQIVFCNADRGGGNKPCVRNLGIYCKNMTMSWCIPHTLNRVGGKVKFPLLIDFQLKWNGVFKNSGSAQSIFYKATKSTWKRKSKVKWWTQFEQLEQVFTFFPNIEGVIDGIKRAGYCKSTIPSLSGLWADQSSDMSDLALSMAGYHDVLKPFVQVTHFLESGDFIAPFVHEKLTQLIVHTEHILKAQDCPPNLSNVYAKILRAAPDKKRRMWQFVQQAVRPGLAYFYELFCNLKDDNTDDDDPGPICFREAVDLFRFAHIFHPQQGIKFLECYNSTNGGGRVFGEWRSILIPRIVSDVEFDALEKELPLLIAALASETQNIQTPAELLVWWRERGKVFGAWRELARVFVLLRPSSAIVERLFSVHLAALPTNMLLSHEDTQELRTQLNWERVTRRTSPKETKK